MIAEAQREMRSRLEPETALGKASLCTKLGEEVLRSQPLHENKSESERTTEVYQCFQRSWICCRKCNVLWGVIMRDEARVRVVLGINLQCFLSFSMPPPHPSLESNCVQFF